MLNGKKRLIPMLLFVALLAYPLAIGASVLLTDTFTGTTINTTNWDIHDTSGTNVSQNDRLSVSGSTAWNANSVSTDATYDRSLNNVEIEGDVTFGNCFATNGGISYGPATGSLASGTILLMSNSGNLVLWAYPTSVAVTYTCVNNVPIHVRLVLKAAGGVDLYLDNAVTPTQSLTAGQAPASWTNYPFSLQQYAASYTTYFDNIVVSIADATAPEAPSGLTATPDSSQIALSWTAPANGGSAITDYIVQYKLSSDGSWSTFSDGTSTSTSATVTGLTNGLSYDFRVAAVNNVGTGSNSSTATETPVFSAPAAPTNLYGVPGSKQIAMTWSAPSSDGGSAVTDYIAEYRIGSDSWTEVADGTSNTASMTITGLVSGETYEVRISAQNAYGTSAVSTSTFVTAGRLGLIDDFTGTVIDTDKWLEFDSGTNVNQNGSLAVTGANGWGTNGVQSVSTFDRTSGDVSVQVSMSGTHCADGSLFNFGYGNIGFAASGESYLIIKSNSNWYIYYYLTGALQESAVITGVSCSVGVPMVMKLVALRDGGAKVYVDGSATAAATILGGRFTNAKTWMQTYTAATTTTFDNLYVIIPAIAPDAPNDVAATAGDGQVSLAWTAPATNGSTITDYIIEYRTGSNAYATFADGTSTSASATVTGLTNGVQYSFRVSAAVSDGSGPFSLPAIATPFSLVAAAPSVSSVVASGTPAVGDTLVGLYTYNDANNNPEGTSTYRWLRAITSGGVYSAISGATSRTYTLTSDDLGMYIKFEVTPVSQANPVAGTAVLSSATTVVTAAQDYLNHILMTGQSLSLGYGGGPALSTTQPYSNVGLSGSSLIPLVESSVETSGSSMANSLTALAPGNDYEVALTHNGVTSTPYGGLKQGTSAYTTGLAGITSVFDAAALLAKISRVIALVVIHGESDHVGGNGVNYESYLVEWQQDFEEDSIAITGQGGIIPLFTDQMSSFTGYSSTTSQIPMGQLAAAENNPDKIFLVTPKYMFAYSDIAHLTNTSYRWLGEYYGKVMNKVLIDHEEWTPLSPKQIVRNGNEIYARFNVPVAPIAFDTSIVSLKANYGFEYSDNSSSATISSVSLVDDETVKITLSGTPSGSAQKLRYAYTGTSGSTPGANVAGSARGNLRDSDPAPSLYGNTLYNWSVQFNKDITADATAPTLAEIDDTPASTSVAIAWTSDEASSSIVDYGLTSAYGNATTETDAPSRVQIHSASITGLLPCITYHYRVRGDDLAQNEGVSADQTFTTTGCPGGASVVAQASESITAASGGSASLTHGSATIELTIPSGATVPDAEYQIKKLDETDALSVAGSPTGLSLAGDHTYALDSLEDISTAISSFTNPITVSITYLDADIVGLDESGLAIYHYSGGTWTGLDSCSVNSGSNTITCDTDGFSLFGLFGSASASSGGSSSGNNAGYLNMYGCKNASASNYEPTAVNHNELLCMYNSGSPLPAPLPVPLPIPEKSKGYIFTRNLRSGMIGNDVKELQKYLNTNGYVLAKSGAGSPGNETTKFGRLTRTLLSAFQKGNNIKPPVGFFGPITRGFINNK